jgi:hypothetical protein
MPHLFISYRRDDSIAITGRIYDRLCLAFGEPQVFKDVDNIPPGANYKDILQNEVWKCDVLLTVIGQNWLTASDDQGRRRLELEDDFVRIEVEAGLKRPEVLVIPVLVDGARMPQPDDLPERLRDLHYRNAAAVRHDPDFNRDMGRLITTIRDYFPPSPVAMEALGAPKTTASAITSVQARFVLPWAGILAGVLLVIAVLAAVRLVERIQQNQTDATATAVVLTATAAATPSPVQ